VFTKDQITAAVLQGTGVTIKNKQVLVLSACEDDCVQWLQQQCKTVKIIDETWRADTAEHHLHGKKHPVAYMPVKGYLSAVACQSFDVVVFSGRIYATRLLNIVQESQRVLRYGGSALSVNSSHSVQFRKQPGFLISSYPRCGTHMLVTALDQHTKLHAYGEVFNPASDNGNHGLSSVNQVLETFWPHDKSGFAAHAYIGRVSAATSYVAPLSLYTGLWKQLPKQLKVISLRRRDLFARFVSHVRAKQSKVWNKFNTDKGVDQPPVLINAKELVANATFTKSCWAEVGKQYPDCLVVYYEDLCEHWERELGRIQEYLGVAMESLSPTSVKLGTDLKKTVINHDAVLRTVKKTAGLASIKAG